MAQRREHGVRTKIMRAPTPITLEQAGEAWLQGARAGLIRTRSGDPYKPGAIRVYEAALRRRVLPEFGHVKLTELTRIDVQDLIDAMLGEGLNASTIGSTLLPLRAIYKPAMARGEVAVNPTTGLERPAVRGGRDRVATPDECARLLAALPQGDRALWATAMYGGLRRGELLALRVEYVDLANGLIHVRRGWDAVEGQISTKSGKDRRVPIPAILRDYIDEHLLNVGWQEGLVFGATATRPPASTVLARRSKRVWKAPKLAMITLHECRHTFASLMIAAGVNAKALSTYMGHANISITLDR